MRCFKLEKEKSENQAIQLKKMFDEVQASGSNQTSETNDPVGNTDQFVKIDVLNLPPRKDVHTNHKRRTRVKIGQPFIRFFVVIILFIISVAGAYYLWGEELITLIKKL